MIPWLHLMSTSKTLLPFCSINFGYTTTEDIDSCLFVLDALIARLNAAYLSIHGSAILGRPLCLKTSSLS